MTGLASRLNAPESVPYPGAHLGLRWRPFMAADAPGVYDLCRRSEAHDNAIRRTSHMEIADMVEGNRGRNLVDTIVGLDSNRTIMAFASVRVLKSRDNAAIASITAVVDPTWRGRGVGRSLLYWQDGRARQMLVETFGPDCCEAASIINLVDSHMTDRRRLSIAAGFSAKRHFQVMYREIEGSEQAPKLADGYALAPAPQLTRSQWHSMDMDIVVDRSHHPSRERWWHESLPTVDDRWSAVATDADGNIVAFCLVSRPVARWVATGRPEAYVEMLGVHKDHRGHHLASQLLSNAISRSAEVGIQRIGLDVDSPVESMTHEMLTLLGFVEDRTEVMYSIDY